MFTIVSAVVIGASAFWAVSVPGQARTRPASTRPVGAPQRHAARLARWLGLTGEQMRLVHMADPSFVEEAGRLRGQLVEQRREFARLLESDETSDEQLLEQLDRIVDTQAALERRAVDHLLKIRRFLTPEQRRRLFHLAARGVRGHGPPSRWDGGDRGQRRPGPQSRPHARRHSRPWPNPNLE